MKLILTTNSNDSFRDEDIRKELATAIEKTGEFSSSNHEFAVYEAIRYALRNGITEFTLVEDGVESTIVNGKFKGTKQSIINESLEAIVFNRGGALIPMPNEVTITIDDSAVPLADIEVASKVRDAFIDGDTTLHLSNETVAMASVRGFLANNDFLADKLNLTVNGKVITIDEAFIPSINSNDYYSDLLLEILDLRDNIYKD